MKLQTELDLTPAQVAELIFEKGSDFFAETLRELYIYHEEQYKILRQEDNKNGIHRWLVDSYGFSLYVSSEIRYDSEITKRTNYAFDKDPLQHFIEDLHSAMWYRQINKIAEKKAA